MRRMQQHEQQQQPCLSKRARERQCGARRRRHGRVARREKSFKTTVRSEQREKFTSLANIWVHLGRRSICTHMRKRARWRARSAACIHPKLLKAQPRRNSYTSALQFQKLHWHLQPTSGRLHRRPVRRSAPPSYLLRRCREAVASFRPGGRATLASILHPARPRAAEEARNPFMRTRCRLHPTPTPCLRPLPELPAQRARLP